MKPWNHALSSVHKWGGVPEDYLDIHNFIDSSKAHIADMRHRALFHSTFGIWLVERVYGTVLTTSAGATVSTRDVAERHVFEDMGTIPTVADWLREMPIEEWMGGVSRLPKSKRSTLAERLESLRNAQED